MLDALNHIQTTYRHRQRAGRASAVEIDPFATPHAEIAVPAKLAANGEDPANYTVEPLPWDRGVDPSDACDHKDL